MFKIALAAFFAMSYTLPAYSVEVIGHRGARASYPESSLTGYLKAIEWGTDYLEMDLRMTRDRNIVIHHDETINFRICTHPDQEEAGSAVYPGRLTLAELGKFDCGSRVHPGFPDQTPVPGSRILSLEKLLELLREKERTGVQLPDLYMEIKVNQDIPDQPPEVWAEELYRLLTKTGMLERSYVDSFNDTYKVAVHNYLSSQIPSWPGISVKAYPFKILTERWVRFLQSQGHLVFPWTVNKRENWAMLIRMGVDGIITDDPRGLIRYLQEQGMR